MALILSPFAIWNISVWLHFLHKPFIHFFIQKKIIRLNFFKRKYESIRKFFNEEKFLTVHELHVYELLKFVLQSLAGLHSETFLNELFVFDKPSYMTRRSNLNLMKIPNFRSKTQRASISYRGAKRFNILRQNSLIPKNV